MGYTQYWRKPNGLDREKFKLYAADVAQLIKGADILQYESNKAEPPEVSIEMVHFNGIGDDGHETFLMSPEAEDFSFCKTARKPYDQYVTACLILAKIHFGDAIQVSSDGDYEDWKEGEKLVNEKTEQKVDSQNYLG